MSISSQLAEQRKLIKMLRLEVESLSEKLLLSRTRQCAPSMEARLTGEQLSIYNPRFNEAEPLEILKS